MKKNILILTILAMFSCDSIRMKMTNTSMEGTIKEGETFWVSPSNKIKRNDIIAFNHTDKYFGEQIWIFRVVGIPGDVIEIKQGKVYANDKLFNEPENLKFSYNVYPIGGRLNPKNFEGFEYYEAEGNKYWFHITKEQKEMLDKNPRIRKIESLIQTSKEYQKGLFKADTLNQWNTDNYGPIEIPNKNTDKLYFVLGDNRHNAVDSRYIGFVSESDVVGIIKK